MADPLSVCQDFLVNPWLTVLIENFGHFDDEAALKGEIHAVWPNVEVSASVNHAGVFTKQVLITADSRDDFDVIVKCMTDEGKLKVGLREVNARAIDMSCYRHPAVPTVVVDPPAAKERISKQYVRKIRPFSGMDKPPGSESGLQEWLMQTLDLVSDKILNQEEKYRLVKNSLVKDALSLVSSSRLESAESIVELISETYGGVLSLDQLRFNFNQCVQKKSEKPSQYLVNLQTQINHMLITGLPEDTVDEIRFAQFYYGLTSSDLDLLEIHLDMGGYLKTKNYPDFPTILKEIQVWERTRRERQSRSGIGARVGAMLVSESYEIDKGKSELSEETHVTSLQKQVSELTGKLESLVSENQNARVAALHDYVKPSDCPRMSCDECAELLPRPELRPQRKKWNRRRTLPIDETKLRCFYCGVVGHRVWSCPNKFDPSKAQEAMDCLRSGNKPQNGEPGALASSAVAGN